MAGRWEGKGTIGLKDHMLPRIDWRERTRNGKVSRYPFMRFGMFAENYAAPMKQLEDGKSVRPKSYYQIILPETKRGEAIFENLYGGRRVMVRGRLDWQENKVEKDGVITVYRNPIVRLDSIDFLDENPAYAGSRILGILRNHCEVINEDQEQQFLAAYQSYMKTLRVINNSENNQQVLDFDQEDSD